MAACSGDAGTPGTPITAPPAPAAPAAPATPVTPPAPPFVEKRDCEDIEFGGLVWRKSAAGTTGPTGPYSWACGNSWLDSTGALHVVLAKTPAGWTGAELRTVRPLGFGRYTVHVRSPVDSFPSGAVFGFFSYLGPGLEREIDIEISRFGGTQGPLWYTVWPDRQTAGLRNNSFSPDAGTALSGPTTHTFDWSSREVSFRSTRGTDPLLAPFATWRYAPADATLVPQVAMPLYFNFWVKSEAAMQGATRLEVVVSRVTAPL